MTTMAHKVLFMCNGSTSPQVCGNCPLPDLPFSEEEFIQAGLLPGASFELATLANPSDDCGEYCMAAPSSRMPARQQNDTGPQQTLSQPVQDQPATLREQKSGHSEKKQANRSHQKRFRERQKERTQLLEFQLERTTKELKGLREQIDKAQVAQVDREVITKPPLIVTLPGKECKLSAADVAHMTPLCFNALWTDYMTELQSFLTAMEDYNDATQEARFVQGIFNLSDAQVKDLMFLREVYVVKESELNLQQASLTACLQHRIPDPVLEVTRVASIGTELKVKAAECHKLLHRLCWAMFFGVMTMKQSAQLLMNADPDLVLAEVLLHHIAQQQGLPSKQEMVAACVQLASQDWTRFWQYTEAVNPFKSLRAEYIPIPVANRPTLSSAVTMY